MLTGYTGAILDVDLTTRRVSTTPMDPTDAKRFLGARGVMTKLLWDRLPPGTTPFSPENLLLLFTGPLTGLLSGNRTILRTKSPLTATTNGLHLMGHAATGGQWGAELKYAGFDGVVVSGRAEAPVYLYVHDGDALGPLRLRDGGRAEAGAGFPRPRSPDRTRRRTPRPLRLREPGVLLLRVAVWRWRRDGLQEP
jgi:aldehyde:ferredoxin oxidoreductase